MYVLEDGFDLWTGWNVFTRSYYDKMGFDFGRSKHRDTGKKWNPYGYDYHGVHIKTGTLYNPHGFNIFGRHRDTGTVWDPKGYNRKGVNAEGFRINGTHVQTGTIYGPDGFNQEGLSKSGFDRNQTRLRIRCHLLSFRDRIQSEDVAEGEKRKLDYEALHFWD